jgi:UDP-N-acetylglucosamine transferase subunit ALG13
MAFCYAVAEISEMVLLLLGTNPYPFRRLVNRVEQWCRRENEHVIGQTGHTPVDDVSFECHAFASHDQIIDWISEARFVICQGGFGSIKDCLSLNKPVLAVPRLQEHGECADSQRELVAELEKEGRIVALYDMNDFDGAIKAVRCFAPPPPMQSRVPGLLAGLISDYTDGCHQ